MADWLKPTITSNYVTFVDEVKLRDIDAITLQDQPVTNPPWHAVKMIRSGQLMRFQEHIGAGNFQDLTLAVAGGGTGMTSLSGLGAAMNLGSIAYQNYQSVTITGGTISNVAMSGSMSFSGGSFTFSSNTTSIPLTIQAAVNQYGLYVVGGASALSYGVLIRAGTGNQTEIVLGVQNVAANKTAMFIYGNMGVHIQEGLMIPSGFNRWVA